jgi:hypothetical protein
VRVAGAISISRKTLINEHKYLIVMENQTMAWTPNEQEAHSLISHAPFLNV